MNPSPISTDLPDREGSAQSTPRGRQLAHATATAIFEAFDRFHLEFKAITRRAKYRFHQQEWLAHQNDARERLDLYSAKIDEIATGLRTMLGDDVTIRDVWADARRLYAGMIARRNDLELGETFFNSVTRRIFVTIGVDEMLEFVWFGATVLPTSKPNSIIDIYVRMNNTASMLKSLLTNYDLGMPFVDLDNDCATAGAILDGYLIKAWDSPEFDRIEMLQSVFYRNKGAYIIGRIRCRNRVAPIILALLTSVDGIFVDSILLTEAEASRGIQFYSFVFPCRSGLPRRTGGVSKIAHANEAHRRTLYRDRLQQARQDCALPCALSPSRQLQRSVPNCAGIQGHGHDRIHTTFLRCDL